MFDDAPDLSGRLVGRRDPGFNVWADRRRRGVRATQEAAVELGEALLAAGAETASVYAVQDPERRGRPVWRERRELTADELEARAELEREREAWEREQEAEREERYLRSRRGERASGWRKGQPQCPGCRRFLTSRTAACPDCGPGGTTTRGGF